jgi:hypothetical protein
MNPSTDTRLTVELLRAFLRWNESRFAHPNADPDADCLGWRRGNEFWLKPSTWRDIYELHDVDPVEAARTLKDSGILRVQDGQNLQAVVKVRNTRVRAYAIDGTALAGWRPVTDKCYGGYGSTQLQPVGGNTAIIPNPMNGLSNDTPNLADKLEAATSLALDEVLGIMRMQLDPEDRAFQAVLRAKSSIINTVISNQVRVDEAMLKNSQHNDVLPQLLAKIDQSLKEHAEAEKEEARKAREEGWADNTVSDELAAKIYRERTSPWVARFGPAT